ncbi:MAG: ATP-binding cassette domain-containing protein [Clostridioides sp.]|jgi:ABC-type dipeptide/oligopeptide/nickel transport system ATPase subunit|nr:ATP-binding cassette domain-containing protein [Clostridioides sp.]
MKTLRVENLRKIYGKGESEVNALAGIELEIEPKKFTAIVGASGLGKSTLLHCMAGLDKPTSGEVRLDDFLISRIEEFGMMRSVGLSAKKLRNMINLQGTCYGLIANILTIAVSLSAQSIIFNKLKVDFENAEFVMDYNLYLIIFGLNMVIAVLATSIPSRMLKKKSIVELTRKAE